MATFLDKILAVFKGETKTSDVTEKGREAATKVTKMPMACPSVPAKKPAAKSSAKKSSAKIATPKAANAKKPTPKKK